MIIFSDLLKADKALYKGLAATVYSLYFFVLKITTNYPENGSWTPMNADFRRENRTCTCKDASPQKGVFLVSEVLYCHIFIRIYPLLSFD
jgi:hypothetical protein